MSFITSFETLDKEIKNAGGRPTVLEALWDGDTNGWFLFLKLYVTTGKLFWQKEEVKNIGTISFGNGDIRLFNGNLPPWPEAALAKEWGQKAADKYKLIFYFPSDKEPDSDYPSWVQRHLAIKCADCAKLIIPTDSPYLPREICYSCHLQRERNEKVKKAAACNDGVNLYLSKNGKYESIGYCTYFKDFTIAPFVIDKVQAQLTTKSISIVTLEQDDIIELKEKIGAVLTQKLTNYKRPIIAEETKRFISIQTAEYMGNEYELMDRFNKEHSEIANLISSFKSAETAIEENYQYHIIFKNGITYRDDTILRFVNYVCKGLSTISEIAKRYANVLTIEDVKNTLKKLEDIGCVIIHDSQVTITKLGTAIV